MSPEIMIQLVQLGAVGLLAFVLYFGLQANAKMIEVLADSLAKCQAGNHELQMKLIDLLRKIDTGEIRVIQMPSPPPDQTTK